MAKTKDAFVSTGTNEKEVIIISTSLQLSHCWCVEQQPCWWGAHRLKLNDGNSDFPVKMEQAKTNSSYLNHCVWRVRLRVSTPEILLIIPHFTDKLCWHTHRSTEDLLSTPGGTRVCLTLKAFCKRSPEKPTKIEIFWCLSTVTGRRRDSSVFLLFRCCSRIFVGTL